MRLMKFASVLLIVIFMLSACTPAPAAPAGGQPAATEAAASKGDLKIGVVVPLSGPVPTFGVSSRDGALLAIEQWNAKGGVLGHKVVPIVEDGQCTPDPAVNAMNKLVDQDGVKFVIGETCSKASIPMTEIGTEKKVITVSGTSTAEGVTVDANGQTKPYAFRACFIDPFQGKVGAKFAFENLKAKKAFIMLDQANDYVKGLAEEFEKSFKELGGEIVGSESYTAKDTDFTTILAKIAEAKPDVIYLPDYYNIVNLVTKQAKEKGITAPFVGGDGWDSTDLDLASAAGGYFTNHYSPEDTRPEVVDFLKAYGDKYKDETGKAQVPSSMAALTYDATNILLTAIQNAGTIDDVEAVKKALEGITIKTVSGETRYDDKHNPIKAAALLKVTPEGIKFETMLNP